MVIPCYERLWLKGIIVNRKSKKERQCNGQKKTGKCKNNKTLHRKLKIEEHEPHLKPELNSGSLGGKAVPVQHVAYLVLLLLQSTVLSHELREVHGLSLRQMEYICGHL